MSRRNRSLRASPQAKGGIALAILAVGGIGAYLFAKAKKDAATLQAESEKARLDAQTKQLEADRATGLEKARLQAEADVKKAEALAKAAEAEAAKAAKLAEEETKRIEAAAKAETEYKIQKDQLDFSNKKKSEAEAIAIKKKSDADAKKAAEAQAQFEAETALKNRLLKYTPTEPRGFIGNKSPAEVAREQYGDWRYWTLITDGNVDRLKALGFDIKYRDRGPLEQFRQPWFPKGVVLDLPPNADLKTWLSFYDGKDAVFQKSAKYSWMVFPGPGEKLRYEGLFGKDSTLP